MATLARNLLLMFLLSAGLGGTAYADRHRHDRDQEYRYGDDDGDRDRGRGRGRHGDKDRDRDDGRGRGGDRQRGMSLDQAVQMVQRQFNARVVRAETHRNGDRTVYKLRLMNDDRVWTVTVDAATGSIQ